MERSRLRRIVQTFALLFFAATIIVASAGIAGDGQFRVDKTAGIEQSLDEITTLADPSLAEQPYRRVIKIGTSGLPAESNEYIKRFTKNDISANLPKIIRINVGPVEKIENNAIVTLCEPVDYAAAFMPIAGSCKKSLSGATEMLHSMYVEDPKNTTKIVLQAYNLTNLKEDAQKIAQSAVEIKNSVTETFKNGDGDGVKNYWHNRLDVYKQRLGLGKEIGKLMIEISFDDSSPLPISVGG